MDIKFAYLNNSANFDVNKVPEKYKDTIIVLKDRGQIYAQGTIIGIGNTAYQGLQQQINNLSDGSIKFINLIDTEPISSEFLEGIGLVENT